MWIAIREFFRKLFSKEKTYPNSSDRPTDLPAPQNPPTKTGDWFKPFLCNFLITEFDSFPELKKTISTQQRPPYLINLELFSLDKDIVTYLKANGYMVCAYFSASWEDYDDRDDLVDFPADAIGSKMDGWPKERWGNIGKESLQKFLAKRMKRAADMGCDMVEVDNIDPAFNDCGFSLSKAQNQSAIITLIATAHSMGLAYAAKNTPDLAKEVSKYADCVFVEEAQQWDEEDAYSPYVQNKKPIFGIEYNGLPKPISGWVIQKKGGYFDPKAKYISP